MGQQDEEHDKNDGMLIKSNDSLNTTSSSEHNANTDNKQYEYSMIPPPPPTNHNIKYASITSSDLR